MYEKTGQPSQKQGGGAFQYWDHRYLLHVAQVKVRSGCPPVRKTPGFSNLQGNPVEQTKEEPVTLGRGLAGIFAQCQILQGEIHEGTSKLLGL